MNQATPLITVGILNYNGVGYLKRIIPQVLGLNYSNKEILIFDNASTDDSLKYLSGFSEVRVIKSQKNLGYGVGKNSIVEVASGEFVLLLDEDILIKDAGALEKLLNLAKTRNPGFISVLLTNEGEESTSYYGGYWTTVGYGYRPKALVSEIAKFPGGYFYSQAPEGGAIFFKKDFFLELGGFDTSQPYYCDVGDIGLRGHILSGRKNIVTTDLCFIHLGIQRKINFEMWLKKFKFIPLGTLKILFYNFTLGDVLSYFIPIVAYFFMGSIYKGLSYKSVRPIAIYLVSLGMFIKQYGEIMKKRRLIQQKRILPTDDFLKIKPPSIIFKNRP